MAHIPKMHFIAKRGYYVCRVNKKQHYLGKDRKVAAKKFRRLMAGVGAKGTPETISQLVHKWVAENPDREWEASRMRHWAVYDGETFLDEIGSDSIEKYVAWLKRRRHRPLGSKVAKKAYSPGTIKHNVNYAMVLLKWASENGWIDELPRKPKLSPSMNKPKDVSPVLVHNAIETLPKQAADIIGFIQATGCRPGEARDLVWDEVDLRRRVCVLDQHKTAQRTGRTRQAGGSDRLRWSH